MATKQGNRGPEGVSATGLNFYLAEPGQIADPRRRSLIGRLMKSVADFVARNPGSPLPRQIPFSTDTGASDALYTSFTDRLWQVYYDRRAIYFDLRDMDRNDPVVSTALSVIADCVVGYEDVDIDGFEWTMEVKNEKALKILNDLKHRLRLGSEVWQIVRRFTLFGEEFRELVVDGDLNIVRFKSLPSYQIMPNFDVWGNKIAGWKQRPETNIPQQVVDFEEWQIIPFIAGAKVGYFGTGLMTSARRSWRRLQKMSDGMAIARMTRAYDKLLHRVPVKPEWDFRRQQEVIVNYKGNMTKRRGLDASGNVYLRDDPTTVETDFYVPDDGTNRGGIEVLSAQNMQLMNVEDLNFHLNELMCALQVPRKYLNFPSPRGALTDAGLTAEDIQFARTLRQRQAVLREGLLLLAQWALLFHGFLAEELGVGIRMAKISTHDHLQNAKIQFTMAQAASLFSQTLLAGGLPPDLVADKYMDLSEADKLLLADFMQESDFDEAKAAHRKGVSAPGAPTPKGGGEDKAPGALPSDEEDDEQGVPAEELAHALTRLSLLCQREAEQQGVQFSVGWDERLASTRTAIQELMITNGRH